MREHSLGPLRMLSYTAFEPISNVTNVVTTRIGGKSVGAFDSLNLGLHVGDSADNVIKNRARVAQALSIEPENLTVPAQIHGTKVRTVGASDRGRGAIDEDDALPGADALITNEADIPLMVLIADCAAVSLYDPRHHAIGLAHAGWKGTLGRITEKTVTAMRDAFGSDPADIVAGISPSISKARYEVGVDFVDRFAHELGRATATNYVLEDMDGTCYLDLHGLNRHQLESAGLRADHIEVCDMCTANHPEWFYSYRRDQKKTGRQAAIMMLHRHGKRTY